MKVDICKNAIHIEGVPNFLHADKFLMRIYSNSGYLIKQFNIKVLSNKDYLEKLIKEQKKQKEAKEQIKEKNNI